MGLSFATIEELEDWLANPRWKASTRATYYGHIVAFYSWAAGRQLMTMTVAGLTRPRVPECLPHLPPDDALADILDRALNPWRTVCLIAAYAVYARTRSQPGPPRRHEQIITVRGGKGASRAIPTHGGNWQSVRRCHRLVRRAARRRDRPALDQSAGERGS